MDDVARFTAPRWEGIGGWHLVAGTSECMDDLATLMDDICGWSCEGLAAGSGQAAYQHRDPAKCDRSDGWSLRTHGDTGVTNFSPPKLPQFTQFTQFAQFALPVSMSPGAGMQIFRVGLTWTGHESLSFLGGFWWIQGVVRQRFGWWVGPGCGLEGFEKFFLLWICETFWEVLGYLEVWKFLDMGR